MLQRMRELAVQASNDTNNANDRSFLNGEFQQLRSEIDRIAQNTQWNGANILDGTGGNNLDGKLAFQVGANANQTVSISLANMGTGKATPYALTATLAATYGSGNGTSTWDFAAASTGLDAQAAATGQAASDFLGVTFQVQFDGKAVQYQVTQADVDANPSTLLSKSVVKGLATKAAAALGTGYTITGGDGTSSSLVIAKTGSTATYAATGSNIAKLSVVTGSLSAIGGSSVSITTGTNAYAALGNIDSAMQTVNQKRSEMGAIISRLQFASDNLTNISSKATESRSRIEDTDYSMATTELAKRNIIQQAAQAMLAQANQAPQMVLQLLK